MTPATYAELAPWESRAGEGPTLRGRRGEAGSGPRLHFLHGNGFCGGVYWPMLKGLLPDYRLFTHDLEGHGASDAPAAFSGTGAILRRVPQVIAQQLPGEKVIGVGHSYGAAVTMAVAAKHPERFSALVLLDPIILPPMAWFWFRHSDKFGRNFMANAARRRRDRWASAEEAADKLRDRGIYKGWSEEALQSFIAWATRDEGGERVLCCPKDIEASIFTQPVYPWRAIPQLKMPVLFLRGAQSYEFFPWTEKLIARRNPAIRLEQTPGGHCFMQEHPDEACRVVRRFLDALFV